MKNWSKILHLNRLNFSNQIRVITYLLKSIFGLTPSLREKDIYTYFNYLILFNGTLTEDSEKVLTTTFRRSTAFKLKMRKFPSSDLKVFEQVYFWNGYSCVLECYRKNYSDPGKILNIIDCGSNIGLTSLYFLESFPNSRLLAIEPEKENFALMNFNLDNSIWPNIEKLNGAVWSSNSKIKILKDFRDQSDWSFRVEETKEENSVEAFSIDYLIKAYKFNIIDILKIDIEGAEAELFTSPNSNLDFLKITKCLAIEIHDEFNCRSEIERILKDYGFILFNWSELTIGYNQNLKLN